MSKEFNVTGVCLPDRHYMVNEDYHFTGFEILSAKRLSGCEYGFSDRYECGKVQK